MKSLIISKETPTSKSRKRKKPEPMRFKCSLCDYIYIDSKDLKQHFDKFHNKKKIKYTEKGAEEKKEEEKDELRSFLDFLF